MAKWVIRKLSLAEERMSKRLLRPSAIRLMLVAIILILGYVALFAKSTVIVHRAKVEAARNPALSMIPVSLTDVSVPNGKAKAQNSFGFEFEVPWKDAVVTDRDSSVVVVSPSTRAAVTFFDPAGEHGLVSIMHTTPGLRPEWVYSTYGRENAESDYQLTWAALNTSPSDLTLLMPGSKQIFAANLMWMKEAYLAIPKDRLYSFELGALRGFQNGTPSNGEVFVDAYDADDHKFAFVFTGDRGSKSSLTQADINRVLSTFHPVADED